MGCRAVVSRAGVLLLLVPSRVASHSVVLDQSRGPPLAVTSICRHPYTASFIFGHVFGDAIFFVPLVWIGFPPRAVLLTLTLNLLYQTWIHVTWIPKLGPLEWIFNTPSAHRVHHAVNIEYLDANYGGVLTIFDRLFGTYVEEREDLPCRYGLVHPQTSHNPLRVEFDQWPGLMIDLFRARKIADILGFLAKPPGWRPDGPGETTEELRRRARTGSPHVACRGIGGQIQRLDARSFPDRFIRAAQHTHRRFRRWGKGLAARSANASRQTQYWWPTRCAGR